MLLPRNLQSRHAILWSSQQTLNLFVNYTGPAAPVARGQAVNRLFPARTVDIAGSPAGRDSRRYRSSRSARNWHLTAPVALRAHHFGAVAAGHDPLNLQIMLVFLFFRLKADLNAHLSALCEELQEPPPASRSLFASAACVFSSLALSCAMSFSSSWFACFASSNDAGALSRCGPINQIG